MILFFIQLKIKTKGNLYQMRNYIQEDLYKTAQTQRFCECCKLIHQKDQVVQKITIDYLQPTCDTASAKKGSNSCEMFCLNVQNYEIQSLLEPKSMDQSQSSQFENDSAYSANEQRGPYKKKKKKANKEEKESRNQNHFYNNAKYLGELLVRKGLSQNEQIYLKLKKKNRGRQQIQAALRKESVRKQLSQIFKASEMKRQIQLGRGKIENKIFNMRQYRKMVYRFAFPNGINGFHTERYQL